MLLDVNTVLESCIYGKCVWCTFSSSACCLHLYALLRSFNQNSSLLQSRSSDSVFQIHFKAQMARSQHSIIIMLVYWNCQQNRCLFLGLGEPTFHADTRILSCRRLTGIGFPVHQLWRWIRKQTRCWLSLPSPCMQWHCVCRPNHYPIPFSDRMFRCFGWDSSLTLTLLRTLLPRRCPRDLPSQRRSRRRRRRRRRCCCGGDGCGRDARVPRHGVPCVARGPPPVCPGSAAPLGTRMYILHQPFTSCISHFN